MPYFINAHRVKVMNRIMVGKPFQVKCELFGVPVNFNIIRIRRNWSCTKLIVEYVYKEDFTGFDEVVALEYALLKMYTIYPNGNIHTYIRSKLHSYFNVNRMKVRFKFDLSL